uniref:Uncharacterized protein n=1 Tax=Rhizophora mucronata TaxID=61149 RepID=A0A2P2MZS2_RHIMU
MKLETNELLVWVWLLFRNLHARGIAFGCVQGFHHVLQHTKFQNSTLYSVESCYSLSESCNFSVQ